MAHGHRPRILSPPYFPCKRLTRHAAATTGPGGAAASRGPGGDKTALLEGDAHRALLGTPRYPGKACCSLLLLVVVSLVVLALRKMAGTDHSTVFDAQGPGRAHTCAQARVDSTVGLGAPNGWLQSGPRGKARELARGTGVDRAPESWLHFN